MQNTRRYLGAFTLALCAAFPLMADALPGTTASKLSVYTTDNVPSLTIGYVDQFGNANGGQITLNGVTSGTSIIKPPAAAGAGIFTLPAGATDTLVSRASTDTLTNKTLTAPILNNAVITGPAPVACGATCTISGSGGTTLLGTAAGSVATLPAATGTGNIYNIVVSTTTTSAAHKVLTNPITDVIIGNAIGWTGSTPAVFSGGASTYHSIQMPFSGSQPSGGFKGDTLACKDIASALWHCTIIYQGGTTPTTPFSAATS